MLKNFKFKTQVVTVGSATEDLIFLCSEALILPGDGPTREKIIGFEYGAKIPIGQIKTCLGGAGANVACGMARLGLKTKACVAVGGDDAGKRIKRSLAQAGVGVDLVHPIYTSSSDRSVIMVEAGDRDRTIFYSRDAGNQLKLKDISQWRTEWVFISSLNLGWEKKLGQILKLRRDRGTKIAFNPGKLQILAGLDFLAPLLKETSVLILNWDEALELVAGRKDLAEKLKGNKATPKKVIKYIQSLGPQVVVITHGRKGSMATDGSFFYKAPALSPKRVELTGAGDAFSSGFLASWIYYPGEMKKALSWGITNSGSAVMYFGAQKGLLTLTQMKRRVNEVIMSALIKESSI
mgnify:CR=1 FL=1